MTYVDWGKVIVKALIVVTTLAAAVCWLRAATAKAPEVGGLGPDDQFMEGTFSEKEGYQMLADAALQS
jgi:hypothetical protein